MAARCRRVAVRVLAAIVMIAGPFTLAACSGTAADQIDYAVDGSLITYNTNTVAGAASAGARAFARTLIGFGYHGPAGQVIVDRDFGTVSVVGRAPLVLDYQIDQDAVYSDDKPITCDDMVLAWAAQSGRFAGFDAANRAGYADIALIECQSGEKKARVSFAEDRSFVDYAELFTATSLMPSHVIANELGLDGARVTAALLRNDVPVVERIAQLWNKTWDLKPNIDPQHFPSSGPYKIESVLDNGVVVLVTNDRWWGAAPVTKRVNVRPQGADIQDRINKHAVDVVDVMTGALGSLITPDDYRNIDAPSDGIEQLIFAPNGRFEESLVRRALAQCAPRDVIARNAAAPIANSRLHPADEDTFSAAENAVPQAADFTRSNPDAASQTLGGAPLTVRIGYRAPNARRAATVGEIAKACGAAGIVVSDASSDTVGPQTLRDGKIDVLLAGTGGASDGGSTGSSAMDAYDLYTGNGNNLSGYSNQLIDSIIDGLAASDDPANQLRLLGDGAPVLWADMPTLPLYRQQRTLVMSKKTYAVGANPTRWGAGWNMDRWVLEQ